MNQLSLLEESFQAHPASVAKRERDRALKAVEEHAMPEWLDEALEAVRKTAERLPEFISDEVWESGLRGTVELRALGPVMRKAARLGYIRRTNFTRPSIRSHMAGKPIWESLLFRGES